MLKEQETKPNLWNLKEGKCIPLSRQYDSTHL